MASGFSHPLSYSCVCPLLFFFIFFFLLIFIATPLLRWYICLILIVTLTQSKNTCEENIMKDCLDQGDYLDYVNDGGETCSLWVAPLPRQRNISYSQLLIVDDFINSLKLALL